MGLAATEPVTVIVEQAIEFEYRDGLFYARSPLGDRAMRWHTFLLSFQSAAKVIQSYYAKSEDGAEIIQFPGRSTA